MPMTPPPVQDGLEPSLLPGGRGGRRAKLRKRDAHPPTVPPLTVVHVVGDIHGRLDLLACFTQELETAAQIDAARGAKTVAVFLGDYIDRGPDPAGVISHLIALRDRSICGCVFLRGNHEEMLLKLVSGGERGLRWLKFGGATTLASYGVDPDQAARGGAAGLREAILRTTPPEHLQFLEGTQFHARIGDYVFVHAGLRPDRPLEAQAADEFLWRRYYDEGEPVWSETVVHGHLVNARPVRGHSRIGIDTGAYESGNLTVLRLEDRQADLHKIVAADRDQPVEMVRWAEWDSAYVQPERAATQDDAIGSDPPPQLARPGARSLWQSPGAVFGAVALCLASGTALWMDRSAWIDESAPRAATAGPQVSAPRATPESPSLDQARAMPALTVQPVSMTAVVVQPTPGASRVQIGALPTEESAKQTWESVIRRFPGETASMTLQTERVSNSERPFVRALVTGFGDADEAAAFCAKLTAAGKPCFVRRG